MTIANWVLTPDRAVVMHDSLATNGVLVEGGTDFEPRGFLTKARVLPHRLAMQAKREGSESIITVRSPVGLIGAPVADE